ncbi:hypothetical protein, partial [Pseudomonas syringae pv. coryli]|uniref:hypothetical protein n=1 Tax=Pseudomonas syringae pv. coryli TaxID=317659 RepID=UPI001C3F16EA
VQAIRTALKSRIKAGSHPSSSGWVCKMRRATLTCCLQRVCLMPFERLPAIREPRFSLRQTQNRPYIDRNAFSGQYAKSASSESGVFDLSGLRPIQTNVCIGPAQWCRYNANH